MQDITIFELNDLFIDTINRCRYDLLNKDDEMIEYELLEEFNSGVISFLHPSSLDRLFNEKFINEEIKKVSLKLRELFLSLKEENYNANSIRSDKEWLEIFKLSDSIREKKNKFDMEKS